MHSGACLAFSWGLHGAALLGEPGLPPPLFPIRHVKLLMDLQTVVSGVYHAMQEDVVSEILRLLRAQPAKATPCLLLLRGDGLDEVFEKAFLETYVKMSQMPKEFLKGQVWQGGCL